MLAKLLYESLWKKQNRVLEPSRNALTQNRCTVSSNIRRSWVMRTRSPEINDLWPSTPSCSQWLSRASIHLLTSETPRHATWPQLCTGYTLSRPEKKNLLIRGVVAKLAIWSASGFIILLAVWPGSSPAGHNIWMHIWQLISAWPGKMVNYDTQTNTHTYCWRSGSTFFLVIFLLRCHGFFFHGFLSEFWRGW